jgi:hypothetical protein
MAQLGGKSVRVKLTCDLTRYHSKCIVGAMGWTIPRAELSEWGKYDRFVAVDFDDGPKMDVLWTSLEIIADPRSEETTPVPISQPEPEPPLQPERILSRSTVKMKMNGKMRDMIVEVVDAGPLSREAHNQIAEILSEGILATLKTAKKGDVT